MNSTFKGLVVRAADASPTIETLSLDQLPPGDVLVDVRYSTLNYKDGLALNNPKMVIRNFPMVPGVDFSGVVLESASPDYSAGDEVVLTGWEVGEKHWGGFAQRARVKSGWLVPLPAGLTLKQAMSVGTAGVTAMLCVDALVAHGVVPGGRPVAVTGAAGGVGSLSVAILAKRGYAVAAVTGRAHEADYLRSLGASEVIAREDVMAGADRPLQRERWAGAVDNVGGPILGALFPSIQQGGSVAACGNAAGLTFTASVLPFILRGVNLLGINSLFVPAPRRREIWARLVQDLPSSVLDEVTAVVPLSRLVEVSREILAGRVRGRTVVDLGDAPAE